AWMRSDQPPSVASVEREIWEPPIGRHPCMPLSKLALASMFLGPSPDLWDVAGAPRGAAGAWRVVPDAATGGASPAGCLAGPGPPVATAHATAVRAKRMARPTPVHTRQLRRRGGGGAGGRGGRSSFPAQFVGSRRSGQLGRIPQPF